MRPSPQHGSWIGRGQGWRDGDSEPGIAVALRSVIVAPGAPLVDSRWVVSTIGLHAIAPHYERADRHDDEAVLEDVLAVALDWPKHLGERPGAFAAGQWRGALGGLDHTLNARTWLPGGPELYLDPLTGHLCARWWSR